jgi:hypothetical protein
MENDADLPMFGFACPECGMEAPHTHDAKGYPHPSDSAHIDLIDEFGYWPILSPYTADSSLERDGVAKANARHNRESRRQWRTYLKAGTRVRASVEWVLKRLGK